MSGRLRQRYLRERTRRIAAETSAEKLVIQLHDALEKSTGRRQELELALRCIQKERKTASGVHIQREIAEEAADSRLQFLVNMSHEFRTPLNSIVGGADVLASSPLAKEQRELLNAIRRSGQDMLSIVNDVLDLHAIQNGKLILSPETIDVIKVGEDALERIAVQAKDKGLKLFNEAHDIPQLVKMDGQRLGQILNNLLTNAEKFTDMGFIRLDWSCQNDRLQVVVSDSGIGMNPAQIAAAFQSFVQHDDSVVRHAGGRGIGLPLTEALVHLMGGSIRVESSSGQYTRFIVELPFELVDTEPAKLETSAASEIPKSTAASQPPPLRILLAEDNLYNQAKATGLLAQLGQKADIATTGTQAVQRALEGSYDLILMNLNLPQMSGVAATAQLRAMQLRTRIVGITSSDQAVGIEAGRKVGMDGCIVLPLDAEVLEKLLS